MKYWLLLLSLLLLSLNRAASAVGSDPSQDWRSADSTHFTVHFTASQRAQAEQAIAIAEQVLPRLTSALRWQPRARIHLVLFDDYDLANGYATPLPFNHTAIFLTPPDDGELLENSDWLTLVLTHELTHIVHLDKVAGAPKALQNVFGRFPLLFPNLWQPTWLIEGLATYVESEPEAGRGRLDNAMFDAYMRLEVQSGVKSLREINSDGRAFPINKAYLYGAYFYRFLAERYGEPAVYKLVEQYSNNLIPFRIHSNPVAVTKKPMDLLWLEYQDWLRERFADDSKASTATAILPHAIWQLDSPVLHESGELYVVADDGVQRPELQRVTAAAEPEALLTVEPGTRIDINADREIVLAQPEICDNYHYYYDLYRWDEQQGLQRLTECGRYRFVAWQNRQQLIAIRNDSGRAELVQLSRDGVEQAVLLQAASDEEIPALAVSGDGQLLAWLSKQHGHWRLQEMTLADRRIETRWHSERPLLSLRYDHNGDLLFVQDQDRVFNAQRWHRNSGSVQPVTETRAAVLAVATASRAAQPTPFVTLELAAGGYQLYRHAPAVAPEAEPVSAPASTATATLTTTLTTALTSTPEANNAAAAPAPVDLQNERDYSGLETLAPRAWFPTAFVDDGAVILGAEFFGQDAVGWHQYTLSPQFEFTEGELLGSASYGYNQRHFLSIYRELDVTRTREDSDGDDEIAAYELSTTAQWISLLPLLRLDQRLHFGIGAASARESYQVVDDQRITLQDERIAAAFFSYDSRRSNWWSEGPNHGQLFSLLAESYDPFDGQYEGKVYRADWRGYLAAGPTTLALRLTEARGDEGTEPFELGGAYNSEHGGIPRLNERDLALRGYDNGIPELTGKRARIGGVEWRLPLTDLDRHLMTPPIGLNRLSAALFYEAGAAWTDASSPERYYRSAGIELLAELKLGYRLGLLVRAGFARGLDEPGGDEAYLRLGRSF